MKWISVNEKLPRIDESVLAYSKNGYIYQCHLIFTQPFPFWCTEDLGISDPYIGSDDPTHWAELPLPPKE